MKEFTFSAEQFLPYPVRTVFDFFSDARNLQAITPDWLSFEVITSDPIVLKTGTLIDYRIRIHGFPVRWRTEIEEWNPPHSFVDTQIRGPYALWHHTHLFQEQEGGTLCVDKVRYWPLGGRLMNWLFVRRDVERIFAHRRQSLDALFPAKQVQAR